MISFTNLVPTDSGRSEMLVMLFHYQLTATLSYVSHNCNSSKIWNRFLVHGQVTIIFVVSVCLFVCLFVCAAFFSSLIDFDQTRSYVICLGLAVSPRI